MLQVGFIGFAPPDASFNRWVTSGATVVFMVCLTRPLFVHLYETWKSLVGVREHFYDGRYVVFGAGKSVEIRQNFLKIRIFHVIVRKCPVNIVGAQIGELNAFR